MAILFYMNKIPLFSSCSSSSLMFPFFSPPLGILPESEIMDGF